MPPELGNQHQRLFSTLFLPGEASECHPQGAVVTSESYNPCGSLSAECEGFGRQAKDRHRVAGWSHATIKSGFPFQSFLLHTYVTQPISLPAVSLQDLQKAGHLEGSAGMSQWAAPAHLSHNRPLCFPAWPPPQSSLASQIQSLTHLAIFFIPVPRQFLSHLSLLFCFLHLQGDG